MPVPITDVQIQQLQAAVATLVSDKATADAATADASAKASALLGAQQAASDANTAEATADGVVNVDLANLGAVLTTITGTPISVTPPPAPPAPATT